MLGSRRSGHADEETFLLSNVVISMDVARTQTKRVGTGRLPLQAQRAFVFGSRSDEAACPRPRRSRFLRCSSNACALRLNRTQVQQVLMEMGRWWIGRRFGVESLQGCSSKTGGYSPFFGEKSDADVKIRPFREFRTYFLLAVQRNYLMRGVLFVVIPTF